MNGLFANLLKKEWLDSIRDRRAFTAAMMIAFIGPVMLYGMVLMLVDRTEKQEIINITLEAHEQFPSLLDSLASRGIFVDNADATDSEITVILEEDFAKHLNEAKSAEVTIIADFADKASGRRVKLIKSVFQSFNSELVGMRLVARGISPQVVAPIKIIEQDTSSAQSRAALFLGMVSSFVLMSVFVAATNVAIDCSAGERERNALEFLLAQPVKTLTLVLAKTFNTTTFGLIGAALTLAMMGVSLHFAPLHKLGFAFEFSLMMAIVVWLVMIPVAAFAASMQLITSFKSKTFKEAQSYLNMTIMVPLFIPMIISMADFEHPALAWLPLTGQNEFITNLVKGEDVNMLAMLACSAVTLGVSAILVGIITKGLKTEKMILGL